MRAIQSWGISVSSRSMNVIIALWRHKSSSPRAARVVSLLPLRTTRCSDWCFMATVHRWPTVPESSALHDKSMVTMCCWQSRKSITGMLPIAPRNVVAAVSVVCIALSWPYSLSDAANVALGRTRR